jgi:CD109 antigen
MTTMPEVEMSGAEPPPKPPSPPTVVRKDFPETWLWTELTTGTDGRATMKASVPDTITSWILSAFAMSPDVGFGIAPDVAKLTVFKPFFLSLNLPYSVIRGEEFALQVTVFNYLPATSKVVVILKQSTYFKVRLGVISPAVSQTVATTVQVPSNDAVSIYFWIVPITLGQIPIEVSATSGGAADAVRAMLLVEPEGIPQEYCTSVFISLTAGQTYNNTLGISLPYTLVPGSEYIQVNVIGNGMGSSLEGLSNLLNMPYGCGEQTMLSLAPDVYVLDYLHAVGQDSGPIRDNALTFINSGYQRELTYQRRDGSFCAFGNDMESGSVWLSAFVIKCFHEAKEFIPVDDAKIAHTLIWLTANQAGDGSFREPPGGVVLHTDMQSGTASSVTMTAFVLISLLENADNTQVSQTQFTAVRANAIHYVESQLDSVKSDPYALSIVTYALTFANSSLAGKALAYLNKLASVEGNGKYWQQVSSAPSGGWVPPYQQARAVDVEMTAYALLTYTLRGDYIGGFAVATWLLKQQNSRGGFTSTQDTVMALQALAKFSASTFSVTGNPDLLIDVTAGSFYHQFTIVESNALILQTAQLPSDARQMSLFASGLGVGLVQMCVKYNIYGKPKDAGNVTNVSTYVDLVLNVVQTDEKNITMEACVKWLGDYPTGMTIIQVGVLTGYVVDNIDDLRNQAGGVIRRVDSDASSLVLYLNEFTPEPICFLIHLTKVLIADNVQPASVVAYLYYDPVQRDTAMYQPTAANVSICIQCPKCCEHMVDNVDCDEEHTPKPRVPGSLPTLAANLTNDVITYIYRATFVKNFDFTYDFEILGRWPLATSWRPPKALLSLNKKLLESSLIKPHELLEGATYVISGPHDTESNYNIERLISI